MKKLLIVALLSLLPISACEDETNINFPTGPSDTTPSRGTQIEYRVIGNATSVRVKYSNAIDGTNQVMTALPYFVTFSTDRSIMFLSLEVTPILYTDDIFYPFTIVQIFVNGVIFRETTSNRYDEGRPLLVSGTWRK